MNSISLNSYDEMDVVSKDPSTAYALWLGMSASEFEKIFHKTPWKRELDENGVSYFSRDTGNGISQSVLVALQNNKIDSFSISFEGKNAEHMTQLHKMAVENLRNTLGWPHIMEYGFFASAMMHTWFLGNNQVLRLKYGKLHDGTKGKPTLQVSITRSFEYEE